MQALPPFLASPAERAGELARKLQFSFLCAMELNVNEEISLTIKSQHLDQQLYFPSVISNVTNNKNELLKG